MAAPSIFGHHVFVTYAMRSSRLLSASDEEPPVMVSSQPPLLAFDFWRGQVALDSQLPQK